VKPRAFDEFISNTPGAVPRCYVQSVQTATKGVPIAQ
jgi:hypothetical protein